MCSALLKKNRELEEAQKHLDDVFHGRVEYDDDDDDNDEVRDILKSYSKIISKCRYSRSLLAFTLTLNDIIHTVA